MNHLSPLSIIQKDISQMESDLDYIGLPAFQGFQYMQTDPGASLYKFRIAAEALVKRIHQQISAELDRRMLDRELDTLIHDLGKHEEVPETIVMHLRNIQHFGNYASHDQGPDAHPPVPRDAIVCLEALCTVSEWYFQHFYGEETLSILDYRPSSTAHAQKKEEEAALSSEKLRDVGYEFEKSDEPWDSRVRYFKAPKFPKKKLFGKPEPASQASDNPGLDAVLSRYRTPLAPEQREGVLSALERSVSHRSRLLSLAKPLLLGQLPQERRASVEKILELAAKHGFRLSNSARSLAIKIREGTRSDMLWRPTLALISPEGEVEIVPKWIVPDVGVALNNGALAQAILDELLQQLQPLRKKHSRFPGSFYYEIDGREQEFISALADAERRILENLPDRTRCLTRLEGESGQQPPLETAAADN